jgi:SAM-dependent methyltransferase
VPDASDRGDRLRARFYPESRFGGYADVDGTVVFHLRVRSLLSPEDVALDVGCGRGNQDEEGVALRRDLRILRGHCARVIGIDVDPAAAENPHVDEFRLIEDPARWPVRDGEADLAVADFVLEHVEDPDAFLGEAHRALKPGGHLCLRTVNARSYLGVASRLVPVRLHEKALARLQPDRPGRDVFPTVYRCNTRPRLRRALARHGFDGVVVGRDAEPAYLAASPAAYRLGVWHGRLAPGALKVGLFAYAQRR